MSVNSHYYARRPIRRREVRAASENVQPQSHAAIPVAVILLALGLVLGRYTVLIPGLLGIILLGTALSFVSTRINPLSIGFYLGKKPSWTATGAVFLCGLSLLGLAYLYWQRGIGPLLP